MVRVSAIALFAALTIPAYAEVDHAQDKNWSAVVARGLTLSIKSFGKPFTSRNCYPKTGSCEYKVLYIEKGVGTVLVRVVDDNDNTTQRVICRVNEAADVQHCIDFDDSSTYTRMRDANGDWSQVGGSSE